jgi:hypothetical protein
MPFTLSDTLANAERKLELFQEKIAGMPYEAKGILFSEIFFLYSVLGDDVPIQILESGRARAQSTFALGVLFPESRVVSLERYEDSEDVEIAEKRLAALSNVSPLYGDSEIVLPALGRRSDVVMIDGPKRFRAIRLALRMLATGKPRAVFLHDCHNGLPERGFLEKYLPESFFSDDPTFVERYRSLDDSCWRTIEEQDVEGWRPYQYDGAKQASYGPTLGCIPFSSNQNYKRLLSVARMLELYSRFVGR